MEIDLHVCQMGGHEGMRAGSNSQAFVVTRNKWRFLVCWRIHRCMFYWNGHSSEGGR